MWGQGRWAEKDLTLRALPVLLSEKYIVAPFKCTVRQLK